MSRILLIAGAVLLVLWALGFITSYFLGGYVHVLLAVALLCFTGWLVLNIMESRRNKNKNQGTAIEDVGKKINHEIDKVDQKISSAVDSFGQKIIDTGQNMKDAVKVTNK